MNKSDVRNAYKLRRSQLSSSEIKTYSNQIFNHLKSQFELENKTIHLFIPISKFNEVDTKPFIKFLFELECTVVTSITHFNPLDLSHCFINQETKYETDKFGIPTPIDSEPISENKIDIVIVPLLAFDENGGRVGYGKGLYDRFLSNCRDNCIKIGVSFFDPISTISDIDENDISLDFCATPNQFYKFQ